MLAQAMDEDDLRGYRALLAKSDDVNPDRVAGWGRLFREVN